MTIKCIAIDDEPLALQQIKSYIHKMPFMELVAACSDTFSAMEVMGRTHIDAIFADINMPDLNGLDFIRSLENSPLVVFTTAYSDYAIAGYKVNAVDYLLKPYGFDDFFAAATKVKKQFDLEHNEPAAPAQEAQQGFIYVKSDHSMSRIDTSTILYIEAMGEYVRIYTTSSERPHTALLSMKKVEQTLAGGAFLRVHKSYIVNMSLLTSVNKSSIILGKDICIPIGYAYKTEVEAFVESHSLH